MDLMKAILVLLLLFIGACEFEVVFVLQIYNYEIMEIVEQKQINLVLSCSFDRSFFMGCVMYAIPCCYFLPFRIQGRHTDGSFHYLMPTVRSTGIGNVCSYLVAGSRLYCFYCV